MSEAKPIVLLIDDDNDLRSVLERVLVRSGFQVLAAGDGNAGLKILKSEKVDVMVTDIIMPDVEGVELILKVRKDHPTLPIIAMSAGGRLKADGYLKMAKACGANQILEKPFGIDLFVREIRNLLASGGTAP